MRPLARWRARSVCLAWPERWLGHRQRRQTQASVWANFCRACAFSRPARYVSAPTFCRELGSLGSAAAPPHLGRTSPLRCVAARRSCVLSRHLFSHGAPARQLGSMRPRGRGKTTFPGLGGAGLQAGASAHHMAAHLRAGAAVSVLTASHIVGDRSHSHHRDGIGMRVQHTRE